jgi:hypothetical protein
VEIACIKSASTCGGHIVLLMVQMRHACRVAHRGVRVVSARSNKPEGSVGLFGIAICSNQNTYLTTYFKLYPYEDKSY